MNDVKLSDIVANWASEKKIFIPFCVIEDAIKEGVRARSENKSGQFRALHYIFMCTGIKPDIELSNIMRELDE